MAQICTDEKNVISECNKLFGVLKNLDGCHLKAEDENLKCLYKIIVFISNKQHGKLAQATSFPIKYLCNHNLLPTVLVEIIRGSKHIKITTYTIEILFRLIVKNTMVHEADRKTIRKLFWDPHNFKQIIECVQIIHFYFVDKINLMHDAILKLLKIINCLYMRKGVSQTSMVPTFTIQFITELIERYKTQKDLYQNLLPIIKVFCRNRKNCSIISNEKFLNSLTILLPMTTKLATMITILKLLSKNADAVLMMSKCEKIFTFILNTINIQGDKTVHKKHLMTVLYRISKPPIGNQLLTKMEYWNMLFEFLVKNERQDEQKFRLIMIKGYTILNRCANRLSVTTKPLKIDLKLPNDIQGLNGVSQSDDSDNDNEDSDEEDDRFSREKSIERISSEEDYESESEEEDDDDSAAPPDDKTIEDLNFMKPFYQELFPSCKAHGDNRLKIYDGIKEMLSKKFACNTMPKIIENRICRNDKLNNVAYPDIVEAHGEDDEDILNYSTNVFSTEDMIKKIKYVKGLEKGGFARKIVYQLDELLEDPNAERANLPNPNTFKADVLPTELKNPGCKSNNIKPRKSLTNLIFESRFESGNLRTAEQVGDYEYNLHLTPDVNLCSGLQWFYFQVSNMVAGESYTFNIVNFQKVNSQFNYGMQPVLFSVTDYVVNSTGWTRAGEKLIYYGNEYFNNENKKQLRTLTFNVTFPYNNDYCYFAYHYPYTYSRLITKLFHFTTRNPDEIYSRVDKLCTSINGYNEIPLITITAPKNREQSLQIPFENRPLVFLTARVHPSESNSSWVMDGILEFLLDEQDERAIIAREHYIFKIIPMLNPEGVIYGNTRCGLTGSDLNRCWKKPHPILHPEIFYAKKLVQYAKRELRNEILTFIDIHGHSRKKFFFFYGCNPKQSWNDNDKQNADSSDSSYCLMPRLLNSNGNMKLNFCRYTIERKRETTCRVVMWREFDIKCSYTLECSYCSGANKKKMTTKMLRDIGVSIITSLTDLVETGEKMKF